METSFVFGKHSGVNLVEQTLNRWQSKLNDAGVTATPELAPQVAERPPHVVFTEPLQLFSRQVVGDAVDPYRIAQKIFAAVDETGIDADVIDLRWLDRASLDWDTLGASIRRTNRVLIVEQGAIGTSYGGWLADEIQRRYFDWLDAPIERVTGGEASPSISKVLERAAIARREEVAIRLTEIVER